MTKNDFAAVHSTETGFQCSGNWNILHLDQLNQTLKNTPFPKQQSLIIDGSLIQSFDSSGALILTHLLEKLTAQDNAFTIEGFNKEQLSMLDLIKQQQPHLSLPNIPSPHTNPLDFIGKETIKKAKQADEFIILIGDLTTQFFFAFRQFKRFQLPGIISVINSAGLTALPILALLSFLIGVVLAYQMGLQLQTYGANGFIAFLSGMAIFREFGPLITAIIVAGRTSSSFTAQIGSMVLNEEVDALQAMGLSTVDLLVMPKVIGLLIVFPLLVFWSDIFSIMGAMVISKSVLGIGYLDFLNRLQDAVGSKQLFLGLYKAPAFSILIALVGCFQGFRVGNSADSIGLQTTKSVVQALFLIIVADAIYSIIYSLMDL